MKIRLKEFILNLLYTEISKLGDDKPDLFFTKMKLADILGENTGNISNVLNLRRPISNDKIKRFCDYFNINHLYFDDYNSELFNDETKTESVILEMYTSFKHLSKEKCKERIANSLNNLKLTIPYKIKEYVNLHLDDIKEDIDKKIISLTNQSKGVPYYGDLSVTATITKSFNDTEMQPDFFIDHKQLNDCTAYLQVVGDSMYPRYASGETIAVKQIFSTDFILWGEPYLVITDSLGGDLRTIKAVHPHSDENKIILRATNPNYKGDTVIPKESILSMYIIKAKIRIEHL